MNICVVGIGYVGLVAGTCLVDFGHKVICVDTNEEKIQNLQKGIIPIYELGVVRIGAAKYERFKKRRARVSEKES